MTTPDATISVTLGSRETAGAARAPVFPAPSLLFGERDCTTRAHHAARTRSCVCAPHSHRHRPPLGRANARPITGSSGRSSIPRHQRWKREFPEWIPAGACHRARRRRDPLAGMTRRPGSLPQKDFRYGPVATVQSYFSARRSIPAKHWPVFLSTADRLYPH